MEDCCFEGDGFADDGGFGASELETTLTALIRLVTRLPATEPWLAVAWLDVDDMACMPVKDGATSIVGACVAEG